MTAPNPNDTVMSWQEFRKITSDNCKLLQRLDEFPDSILVTGCQRSGTTMLSRIITQSEGMVSYYFGPDDELDAALILSGLVEHTPQGGYCFQTAYVEQCYHEYYEHTGGHKIVWVLRNPYSTIYSLLYNWAPQSLDNMFRSFIVPSLTGSDKFVYKFLGIRGISRVKQAAFIYNRKITQLLEIIPTLGVNRMAIIDYDELVMNRPILLPKIYKFIDLEYNHTYADKIHSKSLKKSSDLSQKETAVIEKLCQPLYAQAKTLRMQ